MKVMVLAGGYDQIELINQLKKYGCYVILVDYFENPIAKKYADYHYQESTLDEESVYKIALKEKVDFVITACTDQALNTMAIVNEQLGLKCYLTSEQALKLTNKNKMKQAFVEYQVSTASYIEVQNINQNIDLQFPLVMKPANSNSSKGVIKVENKLELIEKFEVVKNQSRTNEVIIEEFIEGTEISIDAFVVNGAVSILLVTETLKMDLEEGFIINGSYYNKERFSKDIIGKIEEEIKKIAMAFCLVNSPLLVQAIIKGNNIYIIECSARMGGGSKHDIIHKLIGINIMEEFVKLSLGKTFQIKKNGIANVGLVEYKYCKPGTIKKIIGLEELVQNKVITSVYTYKSGNTIDRKFSSSSDRLLGYLIVANDLKDLEEKQQTIKSNLKVLDEYNQNILID